MYTQVERGLLPCHTRRPLLIMCAVLVAPTDPVPLQAFCTLQVL